MCCQIGMQKRHQKLYDGSVPDKKTTPTGLEPARRNSNRFRICRLNHSATVSKFSTSANPNYYIINSVQIQLKIKHHYFLLSGIHKKGYTGEYLLLCDIDVSSPSVSLFSIFLFYQQQHWMVYINQQSIINTTTTTTSNTLFSS